MRRTITYNYSSQGIKKSILYHAKSLNIPEGWSKQMADKVAKNIDAWIADKEIVTEEELRKQVAKELKILSPDLAYAYRNHDKII